MKREVGKEHIVLDLSCRKTEKGYVIVTDRWQNMTDTYITTSQMKELESSCDEFLVHAVDVEGKNNGIETALVEQLAVYEGNPVTYAGGVHNYEDIALLKKIGQSRIHVTVGSAMDLFGGTLSMERILEIVN